MTKTKTWKIGEYAKGGVITTEIDGTTAKIIGKDWDFSTGSKRSSSQKNAKEWTRLEIDTEYNRNAYREAFMFLTDITTSGYADKILKWFKDNGLEISNKVW